MKSQFVIILLVLIGILGFIIGYSMAPTDVSVVRHGAPPAATSGGGQASGGYGSSGGGQASGGYGSAPASGGYGAAPAGGGGYGAAPATGGYGAPASGGYGAH